jgi:hypothetical protein
MLKYLILSCVLILTFVTLLFAADSAGVVGNTILAFLEKMLKVSPEVALSIYTTILVVLGIVIRVILKKIPGGVEGPIGKVVWWLLSIFFGSGVRLEGSTDKEYVKAQLKKRFPLLNIEIK